MKKLLDVGCGPGTIGNIGYYSSLRKGYDIYGIDFLKQNVEKIKKRFPMGTFVVGDAAQIPFPDNYFDAVIARHVLEHVANPKKVLEEIKRVSKVSAFLTVAVPDERMEHMLSNLLPHYIEGGHHHERIFTEKDITTLLRKEGFVIISSSKQKWPWFLTTLMLALLSRLTRLIKMEKQSGVFHIGRIDYTDNGSGNLYLVFYRVLITLNTVFSFLNNLIPFEIEIIARK